MIYTTKTGKTVDSPYTNAQAVEICKTLKSGFAQTLCEKSQKWGLSSEQTAWLHVLAVEATSPKEKKQTAQIATGTLYAFMLDASKKLQFPKIRLRVDNAPIALKFSKKSQAIYVTNGGSFGNDICFAKITTDGFFPYAKCNEKIVAIVKEMSSDPIATAKKYAQQTGQCCFCGKELKEDVSIECGYGPDCAKQYGLPHKSKKVEKRAQKTSQSNIPEMFADLL